MKWSPPRIERCRWLPEIYLVSLAVVMALSAGCSALPAMSSGSSKLADNALSADTYTPEEKARIAAMPQVPEFDVPAEAVSKIAEVETAKEQAGAEVAKAAAAAIPPKVDVAKSDPPKAAPVAPVSDQMPKKVEKPKPSGVLVTAPSAFAWEKIGTSTGNRPFQTAKLGDDGYRTLVVGSVFGNDPLALELIDQLARRLHDDSLILGGYDCTIIRTLNPDGEANHRIVNEKSQFLNRSFPTVGELPSKESPAEVSFLLNRLQERQPQRVVHLRTVAGANGLIAASYSCQSAAKEASDWLKFKLLMLPENARTPGSLERYISTTGSSEMISIGIPDTCPKEELWTRYGDTLMNLLLAEDVATREIARRQTQPASADRRNQNPGK